MRDWNEICFERFHRASSEREVFAVLSQAVHELGFEHCSYGLRMPLPLCAPRFMLYSDYPKSWEHRYVSSNYFAIDPTVKHALTQSTPLIWEADRQLQSPEFWEEASYHGLRHGWCMPTRDGRGTIALATMVRSVESVSVQELDAKGYRMSWLVLTAHQMMSRFLIRQAVPESSIGLTAREREILRWSAVGKTYAEIASIVSVDDRTVKFHLVNAMRKLNAKNKTEAAVKASILGMLQ